MANMDDYYTRHDLRAICGRTERTTHKWRTKGILPPPDEIIGNTLLWLKTNPKIVELIERYTNELQQTDN